MRECLRLDPEHKDCYPFYKRVKKVAKFVTAAQEAQNEQRWEDCIDAANKVRLKKLNFSFASTFFPLFASFRSFT